MKAVRFVGKNGCAAPEYAAALDNGAFVVDTLPKAPNITVRFEIDGKPLMLNLAAHARDFLDLAISVYIADEAEKRSKAKDFWSRSFDFLVPVKDPPLWAPATEALQKTLHTLSGDHFDFTWPQRTAITPFGKHRATLPLGFDTICLFSGGIDSLLGAHQLLKSGRKVLLVGHQADGITASAQTSLASELAKLFPNRVRFVQTRVARSQAATQRFDLPAKVEDTHRPRSFLFLGLAITIANAARIKEVVIPENGLIAINPPLQKSRLGTLSTRTAHPLYLSQLLTFVQKAGVYSGKIKNPFMYLSKTDMLENLDAALHPLLARSVSCAHAGDLRWDGKPGHRHCGRCVPCIYRRAAMIPAGLDGDDRYIDDVFQNLSSLTNYRQSDFRALVAFALRVTNANSVERDAMVLSHGSFSSDVGGQVGPSVTADYSRWSDMLLRWAQSFLATVDSMSSNATKRIVGLPVARKVVKR